MASINQLRHWSLGAMVHDFTTSPANTRLADLFSKDSFFAGGRELFSADLSNNLHGRLLKLSTFDYPPFTTSRPTPKGLQPEYDGIEVG